MTGRRTTPPPACDGVKEGERGVWACLLDAGHDGAHEFRAGRGASEEHDCLDDDSCEINGECMWEDGADAGRETTPHYCEPPAAERGKPRWWRAPDAPFRVCTFCGHRETPPARETT